MQIQSYSLSSLILDERFFEDASNSDKLWDFIFNDRNVLMKMSKNRFNVDVFYHSHHERQETINIRETHFMKNDVFVFNVFFLSLTFNETKVMNSQQKMILKCTYEALKNDKLFLTQKIQCFNSSKWQIFRKAEVHIKHVVRSNTSCYVDNFIKDYSEMLTVDQTEEISFYYDIEIDIVILSNRISWFFDLKSFNINIDTICFLFLIALHLKCQSLRTREFIMICFFDFDNKSVELWLI